MAPSGKRKPQYEDNLIFKDDLKKKNDPKIMITSKIKSTFKRKKMSKMKTLAEYFYSAQMRSALGLCVHVECMQFFVLFLGFLLVEGLPSVRDSVPHGNSKHS